MLVFCFEWVGPEGLDAKMEVSKKWGFVLCFDGGLAKSLVCRF